MRVLDIARALQAAVQHGGQQGAGVLDAHAAAGAVCAAGPAGVDQPAIRAVLGNEVGQHAAIHLGVARDERGTEAGGERGLRLLAHALLGAGHLGGVAGHEVIHRLRRAQLADRRQHAEGVRRQHHHVARLPGTARQVAVGDELDGVAGPGVLGQRAVRQVQVAGSVGDHVLQHGAEAVGRGIDLRLGLLVQVDDLGVAAALEVEDAVWPPAVLVIADQRAVRVAGQGGLAGAGQAEEQGDVTGAAVGGAADVGAAMHGQHAFGRQLPVHHAEDRLLDLPAILAAGDHHHALGEGHGDGGAAAHAVRRRVGLHVGGVQDDVVRHEAGQVLRLRADEHVAGEQGVPRLGADQAHAHTMGRVGAGIQVLGEQLTPLQVGLDPAFQGLEMRGVQLPVAGAPPDVVGDAGVIDRELVLHGAAGVHACLDDQRALRRQPALAAPQGMGDELRRSQVGMDRGGRVQAGAGKRGRGHGVGGAGGGGLMIHGRAPLSNPALGGFWLVRMRAS